MEEREATPSDEVNVNNMDAEDMTQPYHEIKHEDVSSSSEVRFKTSLDETGEPVGSTVSGIHYMQEAEVGTSRSRELNAETGTQPNVPKMEIGLSQSGTYNPEVPGNFYVPQVEVDSPQDNIKYIVTKEGSEKLGRTDAGAGTSQDHFHMSIAQVYDHSHLKAETCHNSVGQFHLTKLESDIPIGRADGVDGPSQDYLDSTVAQPTEHSQVRTDTPHNSVEFNVTKQDPGMLHRADVNQENLLSSNIAQTYEHSQVRADTPHNSVEEFYVMKQESKMLHRDDANQDNPLISNIAQTYEHSQVRADTPHNSVEFNVTKQEPDIPHSEPYDEAAGSRLPHVDAEEKMPEAYASMTAEAIAAFYSAQLYATHIKEENFEMNESGHCDQVHVGNVSDHDYGRTPVDNHSLLRLACSSYEHILNHDDESASVVPPEYNSRYYYPLTTPSVEKDNHVAHSGEDSSQTSYIPTHSSIAGLSINTPLCSALAAMGSNMAEGYSASPPPYGYHNATANSSSTSLETLDSSYTCSHDSSSTNQDDSDTHETASAADLEPTYFPQRSTSMDMYPNYELLAGRVTDSIEHVPYEEVTAIDHCYYTALQTKATPMYAEQLSESQNKHLESLQDFKTFQASHAGYENAPDSKSSIPSMATLLSTKTSDAAQPISNEMFALSQTVAYPSDTSILEANFSTESGADAEHKALFPNPTTVSQTVSENQPEYSHYPSTQSFSEYTMATYSNYVTDAASRNQMYAYPESTDTSSVSVEIAYQAPCQSSITASSNSTLTQENYAKLLQAGLVTSTHIPEKCADELEKDNAGHIGTPFSESGHLVTPKVEIDQFVANASSQLGHRQSIGSRTSLPQIGTLVNSANLKDNVLFLTPGGVTSGPLPKISTFSQADRFTTKKTDQISLRDYILTDMHTQASEWSIDLQNVWTEKQKSASSGSALCDSNNAAPHIQFIKLEMKDVVNVEQDCLVLPGRSSDIDATPSTAVERIIVKSTRPTHAVNTRKAAAAAAGSAAQLPKDGASNVTIKDSQKPSCSTGASGRVPRRSGSKNDLQKPSCSTSTSVGRRNGTTARPTSRRKSADYAPERMKSKKPEIITCDADSTQKGDPQEVRLHRGVSQATREKHAKGFYVHLPTRMQVVRPTPDDANEISSTVDVSPMFCLQSQDESDEGSSSADEHSGEVVPVTSRRRAAANRSTFARGTSRQEEPIASCSSSVAEGSHVAMVTASSSTAITRHDDRQEKPTASCSSSVAEECPFAMVTASSSAVARGDECREEPTASCSSSGAMISASSSTAVTRHDDCREEPTASCSTSVAEETHVAMVTASSSAAVARRDECQEEPAAKCSTSVAEESHVAMVTASSSSLARGVESREEPTISCSTSAEKSRITMAINSSSSTVAREEEATASCSTYSAERHVAMVTASISSVAREGEGKEEPTAGCSMPTSAAEESDVAIMEAEEVVTAISTTAICQTPVAMEITVTEEYILHSNHGITIETGIAGNSHDYRYPVPVPDVEVVEEPVPSADYKNHDGRSSPEVMSEMGMKEENMELQTVEDTSHEANTWNHRDTTLPHKKDIDPAPATPLKKRGRPPKACTPQSLQDQTSENSTQGTTAGDKVADPPKPKRKAGRPKKIPAEPLTDANKVQEEYPERRVLRRHIKDYSEAEKSAAMTLVDSQGFATASKSSGFPITTLAKWVERDEHIDAGAGPSKTRKRRVADYDDDGDSKIGKRRRQVVNRDDCEGGSKMWIGKPDNRGIARSNPADVLDLSLDNDLRDLPQIQKKFPRKRLPENAIGLQSGVETQSRTTSYVDVFIEISDNTGNCVNVAGKSSGPVVGSSLKGEGEKCAEKASNHEEVPTLKPRGRPPKKKIHIEQTEKKKQGRPKKPKDQIVDPGSTVPDSALPDWVVQKSNRSGKYNTYDFQQREDLLKLSEKFGITAVAHKLNIPVSTISCWRRTFKKDVNRNPTTGRKIGSGRKLCYGNEVDEQILQWILECRDLHCPTTVDDIGNYAGKIVRKIQGCETFKASHGWVAKFKKRHIEMLDGRTPISQKLPPKLESLITQFQRQINEIRQEYSIDPSLIINMDEIPIYFDLTGKKIPTLKGKQEVVIRITVGRKQHLTMLGAVTGAGKGLKPMLIMKGKSEPDIDPPQNCIIEATEKGNVDQGTMMDWVQRVLLPYTHGRPSLLVIDSYEPHRVEFIMELFSKYNVIVAMIPEGCNSKLQPMSVSVSKLFRSSLKESWFYTVKDAVSKMANTPCAHLTNDETEMMTKWLVKSWDKVWRDNTEVVKKAFKVCGISNAADGTEQDLIRNDSYLDVTTFCQEQEHDKAHGFWYKITVDSCLGHLLTISVRK